MKIKKFKLFENTSYQTKGNTHGMGNVKSPQPKKQDEYLNELPSKKIKPKNTEQVNEKIKSFEDFLNEDGGVANATAGNTSGMGNVSSPPVSTDGSVNTYSGDGSPTETVGKGSGDLPAYDMGIYQQPVIGKNKKNKPKKKKKKTTKENRHYGIETSKKDMYVTSWTDWNKKS